MALGLALMLGSLGRLGEQQQCWAGWVSSSSAGRGLEAARAGNTELAGKALGKVGELAPHLNTAAMRTAIAAAKQQQQQQGQQMGRRLLPLEATAVQPGSANGSGSGARPGNQQQQQQQQQKQKQHPKHRHKQKQPPKPPPQQQQQQQQQQGPSSSSNTSDGPAQQQQQQQQQRPDEDGQGFSRSAWEQQQAAKDAGDGGLVGSWCRGYDSLEAWVLVRGELLTAWSAEPGRHWAAAAAAYWGAFLLVGLHFGWTQPLHCAAYVRRAGGDTMVESQVWLGRTAIGLTQHTLAAAAWRVALWCVSGAAAAAAAWAVGWLQLAGHSLAGWGWLLLAGVWRALVWRPWHSVQAVSCVHV
ncbi:hypothetical protein COO60DRAFT_1650421 [Scenedesmus sp. NREL 46B-D3]|nr:hypothetical protein COO60DRAFT_1650421 [Scenedesmus sp. NREL 46B-D3]